MQAGPHNFDIHVAPDRDGDGIPDDLDPYPDDPNACGDSDNDNCDDCSVAGYWDPANDGPDSDGICDQAGPDGGTGGSNAADGCGCRTGAAGSEATLLFILLALLFLALRRRR